jgi:putative serine protease PepD
MDPLNDLAVIKLNNASGLTPAQWADSSKLNVGDTAIAIGAPLGLSGTVTNGIVSALNRSISVASSAVPSTPDGTSGNGNSNGQNGPFNFWGFGEGDNSGQSTTTSSVSLAVVQTDAAINPGNSGGALLNAAGEVIGVNVAIASASSGSSSGGQSGNIGVGFAIPSNIAQRIAAELKSKKSATHGLLGASVGDASAATKSTVAGAAIQSVTGSGAAGAAGLKAGDVVTRFNGVPIGSATDLTAQVRALPGGASTTLTYVRGGQSTTVTVKLGTYRG